jgi:hypothetical protein
MRNTTWSPGLLPADSGAETISGFNESAPLTEFLKNTGSRDANGNYAAGAVDFTYTVPAGKRLWISRMIVAVGDVGSFDADLYGNGVALTNGIRISITKSAVQTFLDAGFAVFSNFDWAELCFDADVKDWGTGPNFLVVRWTFSRYTTILLEAGDTFDVNLNDDFTGLTAHRFLIEGSLLNL